MHLQSREGKIDWQNRMTSQSLLFKILRAPMGKVSSLCPHWTSYLTFWNTWEPGTDTADI